MKRRSAPITIIEIFCIGAVIYGGLHAQELYDYWALSGYSPGPDIVGFADRMAMSKEGRRIFYTTHPVVDDKTVFASDCQIRDNDALELGCYSRNHIYILRVDNAELARIMDVTAAHEMLHAAYARLSRRDRSQLNAELEAAAAKITDPDLKVLMDRYAVTEPGERANELHSILGSEYPNLGAVLEGHYARYFGDRRQVLAANKSFEGAFETRKAALEAEGANIEALKNKLAGVNAQLDRYRSSGNISAYNSLVPVQNRLVAELKGKIVSYNALVDDYNQLSRSFNSLKIDNIQAQ